MRSFRKSYLIKKKRSIFKNKIFSMGILILIILIEIFYLISFLNFFQIKEIKISGNQKLKIENLEYVVRTQIEKKILFLSSRSIFLANLNEIETKILKTFPQVAEANPKKDLPSTIILEIKERKPVAIFLQNERSLFIDEEGVVFEENINEETPKMLEIRLSFNVPNLGLGSQVIEKEKISKILEINSELESNFQIQSEEILIVSEERFNFKTSEAWEIYLDPEKNIEWQLTKLGALLEEEITIDQRKGLEYIELRFGNTAPYKYKDSFKVEP